MIWRCPLEWAWSSPFPPPTCRPQGGGFGLFGRYLGLGCDNVVGLEMVLADGRVVKVDKGERAMLSGWLLALPPPKGRQQ